MTSALYRLVSAWWRFSAPPKSTDFDNKQIYSPPGSVHLVGAGCGDPELLTLRAARLINSADVLLYDRLVAPEIVDMAPPHCRKIYVGKRAGDHSVPQEQIGEMLAFYAQQGHTVVRLKGGDPFVFGRGGEEMLLLRERGIDVDVCPGISAALGCAASTGIPLTHRGLSHGCLFITGQDQFEQLPLAGGDHDLRDLTLVIYMGLGQLPGIVKALRQRGLPEDWPIAVVENGTTDQARQVISQLDSVEETVQRDGIGTPSLLMVGRTVSLAHAMHLANSTPLAVSA